MSLLLLSSCHPPIRGGKITGKFKTDSYYYLELQRGTNMGLASVTEKAWNQAANGMEWPFEVK